MFFFLEISLFGGVNTLSGRSLFGLFFMKKFLKTPHCVTGSVTQRSRRDAILDVDSFNVQQLRVDPLAVFGVDTLAVLGVDPSLYSVLTPSLYSVLTPALYSMLTPSLYSVLTPSLYSVLTHHCTRC